MVGHAQHPRTNNEGEQHGPLAMEQAGDDNSKACHNKHICTTEWYSTPIECLCVNAMEHNELGNSLLCYNIKNSKRCPYLVRLHDCCTWMDLLHSRHHIRLQGRGLPQEVGLICLP